MLVVDGSDRPLFPNSNKRKYPDECWVISTDSIIWYNLQNQGLPAPRFRTFRGEPLGAWLKNPGEMTILPPD
jgi:hypothetical protein